MITETQLAEIEARAEKATPGPWNCVPPPHRDITYERAWEIRDPLLSSGPVAEGMRELDCSFIAAARTDVPALVAEVRRLRHDLEQARLEHQHVLEMRHEWQRRWERLKIERASCCMRMEERVGEVRAAVESNDEDAVSIGVDVALLVERWDAEDAKGDEP